MVITMLYDVLQFLTNIAQTDFIKEIVFTVLGFTLFIILQRLVRCISV